MRLHIRTKRFLKFVSFFTFVLLSSPYKTSVMSSSGSCDLAYENTKAGPGLCICPGGSFKYPTGSVAVWAPSYGPLPDPNGGPCKGCDDCFYMLPSEFQEYCDEWNPYLVWCQSFNKEVSKNARQPYHLPKPSFNKSPQALKKH